MSLETLPPISRDVVQRLIAIETLPTLPAVMNQLLETVQDENASAEDVTAVIERDLAMSARMLRLANSAFYGLRHKVDTVQRAVVVVGFDTVRMLALAMSVFDVMGNRHPRALDPEDFWLHSLGAGKAAQLLASEITGIESPGSCFTGGLLHDMGKYFLALTLKEDYVKAVEMAQTAKRRLQDVEFDIIGVTHADVSAWIAQKWSLPPNIRDMLGFQCRAHLYTGPFGREVAIVELASDIARVAQFGSAGDYDEPFLPGDAGERLGVEPKRILAVIAQLGTYQTEARQFLEALRSR